jgi:hypothetical protein
VRLGVIAAEQFGTAKLKCVMAADNGEIVREFVAAQDADAGDKNVRSQVIDETGDLEPHLSGLVWNHVKAVESHCTRASSVLSE